MVTDEQFQLLDVDMLAMDRKDKMQTWGITGRVTTTRNYKLHEREGRGLQSYTFCRDSVPFSEGNCTYCLKCLLFKTVQVVCMTLDFSFRLLVINSCLHCLVAVSLWMRDLTSLGFSFLVFKMHDSPFLTYLRLKF